MSGFKLRVVSLTALAVLMFAGLANAKSWTVTSSADSGPGTLRQAIVEAASGDSIGFRLATLPSQISLASTITIDKSLIIKGPGAALLTLSGGNNVRVFFVYSSAALALSGVAVADGLSPDNGGGIFNEGQLYVANVKFKNNLAVQLDGYGWGGAIFNASGARLTVSQCLFSDNSAGSPGIHGEGGAIYNLGDALIASSRFTNNHAYSGGAFSNFLGALIVKTSSLTGNTATFEGGGIFNFGGSLMVYQSLVANNSATFEGAGVYNFGFGQGKLVQIIQSSLVRNTSPRSGGGLSNYQGVFTVSNSLIAGNTVGVNGGGVFNYEGTLSVQYSLLSGNSAGYGAGAYSGGGSPGLATLNLTNSAISFNNATISGGGVYSDLGSLVVLSGATITFNSAPDSPNFFQQ